MALVSGFFSAYTEDHLSLVDDHNHSLNDKHKQIPSAEVLMVHREKVVCEVLPMVF